MNIKRQSSDSKESLSNILTIRNNTDHESITKSSILKVLASLANFENKPGVHLTDEDNVHHLDGHQMDEQEEPSCSDDSSSRSRKLSPSWRQSKLVAVSNTEQSQGGWTNAVWKNNALRIMTFVVKFVISLLTNSEKFKFTFINMRQFNAIGDKSSFYQYYVDNKLIREKVRKNFRQKLSAAVRKSWVYKNLLPVSDFLVATFWNIIQPSSTAKILWDLFLLGILILQMSFVPLKICFFIKVEGSVLQFFLVSLPIYVYIVEIYLNFVTGYYEHGSLITDKKQIANNYLQTSFIYDLFSTLPLVFSLFYPDSEFIEFLVLFKIKRVIFLADTFEELFNLRLKYSTLLDVIRLLIQFLYLSHIFGCIWHYIGMLESSMGLSNSWIIHQGISDEPWYIRFIYSIYWSSITTLTIGYGDISPVTNYEQVYVILVAIVSSLVFAYTISNIGQIFSQLNEIKKVQRQKMSLIQSFILQREVNKELQNKVKKFFEYFIQIDNSKDNECQKLMNQLAPTLKTELKIDIYRKYILNSKLFRSTFSDDFINQLCQLVQEKQYTPDDNLFVENSELEEIYFLLTGEVSLHIEANSKLQSRQLSLIKKNHVLGERFFVTGENTPYSAKACTFTRVAYIKKDQFFSLLEKNPIEMEKFNQSKNKINLQERIKIQGCELCYQNHQVLKCPFVFYQPNIRLVVKRMNNMVQKRLYQARKNSKSHKVFRDKVAIQTDAFNYAIEHNLIHEESINDSMIRDLDLPYLEPQKQLGRQITSESSVNTLLQNNLQSVQKESFEEIMQKELQRQNSNNNPQQQQQRPNNPISSLRQLNQLKLLRVSKKLDVKQELKPPDKIVLQEVELNSDSPGDMSRNRKSFSSNYFAFVSFVDVQKILYQDYIKKYDNDILELDKQHDFNYYYPNCNLQAVLDSIQEKKILRRRRSKTRINRTKNRLPTSHRNLGPSHRNLTQRNRKRSAQVDLMEYSVKQN